MPAENPTVRRRQLANELRRLRTVRGLTLEAVAQHLEMAQSSVSRIETGRRGVRVRDLKVLLDLYDVHSDERDALLDLARESRKRGWWHDYSDAMSERFQVFVGFEAEANAVYTYESELVPGMLQTEDYYRAFLRTPPVTDTDDDLDRMVAVRTQRQERLTGDDPPRFWAVLNEAVIRRVMGSKVIMRQQLRRIVDTVQRQHVTVQVLPFDVGGHPAMDGPFTILGFPDPTDPGLVYLDTQAGGLYLEKPQEVERYRLMFDELRANALRPGESIELIAKTAEDLK